MEVNTDSGEEKTTEEDSIPICPEIGFLTTSSTEPPGFSLVEVMVVIAIMVIVLGFTIPSLTGLSKSNSLNSAGRIVVNLITAARSEAINKRSLVRFEVATSWPTDASQAYRKIAVVEHDVATGTDTFLTNWHTLPTGITFSPQDPGSSSGSYFFSSAATQIPKLKIGSQDVDSVYLEFLPTGAPNTSPSNNPLRLRLLGGIVSAGASPTVTITTPNNWFDASVDTLVGRVKITRP